ncbi:MAG: glycosyltransferase family 4 protein [Patescibacteria group bacterium]|nr:glycosyltransferase family 4 protein [Patescibacteria group bacterium]
MKIAMIGQKGIPASSGGIERHVEEMSRRLGMLGHDVTVYTRAWYAPDTKSGAELMPGVRAAVTPCLHTKHLDAITHTFIATLHAIRNGHDVIHYHGVGPSLLAWLPRLFAPRTKVVVTFHCIDRRQQKWGRFARFMLGVGEWAACRFPHETVVVSRTLQEYCRSRFGRATTYAPNGVTPAATTNTDNLSRWGLEPNGYILTVARLIEPKGIHFLVEAFRELKRRGASANLKLVIVGDSSFTDDYARRLKSQAADLNDVIFTGALAGESLNDLYANCRVFSLPSETEGLPLVVLEAMSHGRPVLVSDIPEMKEAVGVAGVTHRCRDAKDLADKLADLIVNPTAAEQLGLAGCARVASLYSWDESAAIVNQVYHEAKDPTNKCREAECRC